MTNRRRRAVVSGRRLLQAAAAISMIAMSACSRGADDAAATARLPQLPIDPASVTVSGISSGGAMATQFHVAHSQLVRGAGILASGPYLCAEGSVREGLGRCMQGEPEIPTARLLDQARQLSQQGRIDPLEGLTEDRVWIFRGAADPYVDRRVVDATEAFYLALLAPAQLLRVEHPGAGHMFPTADPGAGACDVSDSPFLGNCGFDGARQLLAHLYGELAAGAGARDAGLATFDQRPYATAAGSLGLAEQGWIYVPAACSQGAAGSCRLHVVFHGCKQGGSFVGDKFVRGAGYLEVAEANGIVLLFPQVEKSLRPLNAFGCWDWWGYEDPDYATRDGRQVRAIRAMVADLLGEATAAP